MPDVLHTLVAPADAQDRAHMIEVRQWSPAYAVPVTHRDGRSVPLLAADDLLAAWVDLRESGTWGDDRAASDRWLAPRLHWALRLARAQAADRHMWTWLSLRWSDYVEWRWTGDQGVTEDRWTGAVNKQALARLWWGGELFRNGPDYRPVERAFLRQDLPNSCLHRPFVRCRPLALAFLDVAAPEGREPVSADEVNDLARVVNLATAGSPPEAEAGYQSDDVVSYARWVREAADLPADWEKLPDGPPCADTTPASVAGAARIAERCASYAHSAAEARGARSAERRARNRKSAAVQDAVAVSASPYAPPEHGSTGPSRPEGMHR